MRTTSDQFVTADFIVNEVCNDTNDDQRVMASKYYRFLFRVWEDINLDFIRTKREVILPVASSTKTVQLPVDYQDIIFLGYKDDCSRLIPIQVNQNLAPSFGIENMDECKTCPTCGEVDLCQTLATEEAVEDVVIGDQVYQRVITRVIHADGSYTEEVTEPVVTYTGSVADAVEFTTTKKVICQLSKTCDDCVAATPGNLVMLGNCGCTDAACCCCSTDMLPKPVVSDIAEYQLFEQEGFIQFSPHSCLSKVYLKYVSNGVCKNGTWYFPSIAMNLLINGTYLMSIEKKKNVPMIEKERALRRFIADEKRLVKRLTRISAQEFLEIIQQIPRLPALGQGCYAPTFAQDTGIVATRPVTAPPPLPAPANSAVIKKLKTEIEELKQTIQQLKT